MNITLTPEQENAVVAKHAAEFERQLAVNIANHAKLAAALKRRADDRVDRAQQTAKDWKLRYQETRSKLLAAQAEIVVLKRRLRDGDWDA